MAEYGFKKLSSVDTEDSFSSETSKHLIVEDGGSIKRLNASTLFPEPFAVTFSGTDEGENAACNKTYDEIKAAYEAGQELRVVYNDQEVSTSVYPLQPTIVQSETLIFSNLVVSSVTSLLSAGWIGIYCSINKSGAVHCFLDDET